MVAELRGGFHILVAPFSGSESLVGKLRGRHFSGFEGAWLCLTNRFHLFGSSEGSIFRLRGRSVVVAEFQGRYLHLGARRFQFHESLVGKLRGRHFSGLEGTWLCLMNSGAALASWGAVFTCLGAQRTAFFRFRECLVVVAEFRGGLCILGSRFSRAEGAWMERQGSEGGISSHSQGALSLQSSRGGIFSKWLSFPRTVSATVLQLSHKKDERRGAFGA